MQTKEELQKQIEDLQDKLKEAQNKLKNLDKNERWKPEENETYYYLNEFNEPVVNCFTDTCNSDKNRYRCYNLFETEKEANREANKILIRRKLEDIARRLNGDEKIDWNNCLQNKFVIVYDYKAQKLDTTSAVILKAQGCVYCLHSTILKEAIKEIGKRKLINYIKGE